MTTADAEQGTTGAFARRWRAFRRWRQARPFWGGLFTVLAGLEIFGTTQMALGGLTLQMGPTGFLSWLIPTILVTCGLLMWFTPEQRIFYAVVAVITGVFSLIAVNLGGFFLGMLLGMVGGALGFAWTPAPVPPPVDSVEHLEPAPEPDASEPASQGPEATRPPTPEGGDGAGLDLLNDTPPRARNPLRETAGSAATAVRPAMVDETGPVDGVAPHARDHRGPGLLVVLLVVTGLTVTGAVTLDRAEPARAAPCPSGARPQPAPTRPRTPVKPAPIPSATPTPSTSPAGDPIRAPDGNLITDIVGGVRDLLGIGSDETADSTPSPTPSAPASSPAAPAPRASGTTRAPVNGPTPERPAPQPGRCRPDAPGIGKPTTPAKGVVPKLAADPDTPVAANVPSRLTGSKLTMTGLTYEGIVRDFRTQAGPVPVLKFSMRRAVTTDFALQIQGEPGRSLRYESRELTVDGNVEFYTTRFVGWILGLKLTLTPDSPLPPAGIDLSLPIPITFTDPDIQLALIGCDTLSVDPSLRQVIT